MNEGYRQIECERTGEGLRAQRLRPITIWVPDLKRPEIRTELQRQILALAESPDEQDDLAFLESITRDLPWLLPEIED